MSYVMIFWGTLYLILGVRFAWVFFESGLTYRAGIGEIADRLVGALFVLVLWPFFMITTIIGETLKRD